MTPNVDLSRVIATTQSEDDLLYLWRQVRGYDPFTYDGILCGSIWDRQTPKLAFLLKESHDDFIQIRGKGHWPRLGKGTTFWRNINIWSEIVDKCYHRKPLEYKEAEEHKEREVNYIAYVNLKKKYEGKSRSDDDDIQSYVDNDWEFIDKQLSLIAPDVILCGGTFNRVSKCLKCQQPLVEVGRRGVYLANGSVVIDFFHPGCRGEYESKFEQLKKMLTALPASAYVTTGYKTTS